MTNVVLFGGPAPSPEAPVSRDEVVRLVADAILAFQATREQAFPFEIYEEVKRMLFGTGGASVVSNDVLRTLEIVV